MQSHPLQMSISVPLFCFEMKNLRWRPFPPPPPSLSPPVNSERRKINTARLNSYQPTQNITSPGLGIKMMINPMTKSTIIIIRRRRILKKQTQQMRELEDEIQFSRLNSLINQTNRKRRRRRRRRRRKWWEIDWFKC